MLGEVCECCLELGHAGRHFAIVKTPSRVGEVEWLDAYDAQAQRIASITPADIDLPPIMAVYSAEDGVWPTC